MSIFQCFIGNKNNIIRKKTHDAYQAAQNHTQHSKSPRRPTANKIKIKIINSSTTTELGYTIHKKKIPTTTTTDTGRIGHRNSYTHSNLKLCNSIFVKRTEEVVEQRCFSFFMNIHDSENQGSHRAFLGSMQNDPFQFIQGMGILREHA